MSLDPATPQTEEQARFAAAKQMATQASKNGESPVSLLTPLATNLTAEFRRFAIDRQGIERRWLMDLRQFLGIYEPDVAAKLKNRSKAFRRKTRSKVRAVDSRMFDLLFPPSAERNYRIKATPEPTISDEDRATIIQTLGDKADDDHLREAIQDFVDKRADRMGSTIDDQLVDGKYRNIARRVLHSGNLYGTGVLKGPLVERRKSRVRYIYSQAEKKFVLSREEEYRPFIDFTPLWRFYADMAVTDFEDGRGCWERHLMSRHALMMLVGRQTFDGEAIKAYLRTFKTGMVNRQTFEADLQNIGDAREVMWTNAGQYELLERFGWLERDELESCGVKLPTSDDSMYFGNVLMFPNGLPIKAVLQPMEGQQNPYHLYYFDKDETCVYGNGIATIIRGDQEMLNSATRATYDNAAISCGPQIEAYVSLLSPTEKLDEIFPFRIWARTSGDAQYPAIRAINIDSHIPELRQLAQDADASADETSAIPKFMDTGVNPTDGAAGTATGMSMILGQTNIALKDQVAQWDGGITKPFITGMYSWNMQFNDDNTIKGDFDVDALGASSLVAKEVRSSQLAQYAASAQPEERAFINWYEFAVQRAQANELVGIVKSKQQVDDEQNSEEAKLQQQMTIKTQQLQIATMEKNLAVLETKVAQMAADTINKRVQASYAAMQAGGVAARDPAAAAGGDEILKSSGALDFTPQTSEATAIQNAAGVPPAAPPAQAIADDEASLARQTSPAIPAQGGTGPAPTDEPPTTAPVPSAFEGADAGIETPQLPG